MQAVLEGPPHNEIEKAERWALMEWIVVGRRMWLAAGLVAMLVLCTAIWILYADGVSHLDHNELRTFNRRREETPKTYGPLFGPVHEPPEHQP